MNSRSRKNFSPQPKVQNNNFLQNLPPQFELNDYEERTYQAILKRQADENPFSFIRSSDTDATIFRVNHIRVSTEEAKKLQEFLTINMVKGHTDFIIDMSICEFMDSTFFGSIIMMAKKIKKKGGSLSVVAIPQKLKILNTIQILENLLKVYSTIEEAISDNKNNKP